MTENWSKKQLLEMYLQEIYDTIENEEVIRKTKIVADIFELRLFDNPKMVFPYGTKKQETTINVQGY